MKKLSVNLPCAATAAAMLFVLAGASTARAQEPPIVEAHVPFAFIVGNRVLPAGNYVVKSNANDGAILAIESPDGKQFANTLTIPSSMESSPAEAKLVFRTVGSQHFLASVEPADGNARDILLTPATIEREAASAESLSR